ncbi:MAG: 6-phosphofructokinase [Candidatus Omnitrophica bacterium]|nr:6-phosphofructokinase [Candidatus Omnitrophota bacterium]
MKRLAVLTSGGDCPGLNACLRAVIRRALLANREVLGIRRGFKGLMDGKIIPLDYKSTSGIINRGGTFLLSARSEEFHRPSGRKKAVHTLKRHRIDGLIVIGGNGSLRGAWELSKETDTAIIGVPKSIDNDIGGSDYSIGFDTAVNTAVEAIDKIRDTATSHEQLFLVEVMGRTRGFLALAAGVAGGAEEVLIPETPTNIPKLCKKLEEGRKKGKRSTIIVVAEGDEAGGAFEIAKKIQRKTNYQIRVSILGHQQRGGSPTAFDRILASQLGVGAVEALLKGARNKVIGRVNGKLILSSLDIAWKKAPKLDQNLVRLAEILS